MSTAGARARPAAAVDRPDEPGIGSEAWALNGLYSSDGFGNRCDGDMNNNATTNAQDYVLFRQQLGQPSAAPTYNKADINCNGTVNAQDYVLFRSLLGGPPGPSGLVP